MLYNLTLLTFFTAPVPIDLADVTEAQEALTFSDVERARRAKDTQEYMRSLENVRLTRARVQQQIGGRGPSSQGGCLLI